MSFTENEWRSEPLKTTWEKARGAIKLQRVLLENGWTKRKAHEASRHEYAHAKADSGSGVYGLELGGTSPYYGSLGHRTKEELRTIAFAPGSINMSIYDKVVGGDNRFSLDFLDSLASKIRSLKLPFIR